MSTYYNENDRFAADWLEGLARGGMIGEGRIDRRSISDLGASDLAGYTRAHFFAGIGGWDLALRLAGWPEDRPVWTGSCPCQPFSSAGKRRGVEDERHLWPVWRPLIEKLRPPTIFGEQVASEDGRLWLAGIRADLEAMGYAVGAADLCAAGVGAPHVRQRLYWIANASIYGQEGLQRCAPSQIQENRPSQALGPWDSVGNPFENWEKLMAESHVFRMADGISSTLDIRPRLHAYGNAVVPTLAAEFIKAFLETGA